MNKTRTPVYFFDVTAQTRLANFINPATLLAFDLDGTLAPIVPDPAAAAIPGAIGRVLAELNTRFAVAVITGRSRSDALSHLPFTPRYLIGNHGAEGLPGFASREIDFVRTVREWHNALDNLITPENHPGIEIENKGATLALHYRRAVNIQEAHKALLAAVDKLLPRPRVIRGKFVENLLPEGAPDKAAALQALMANEGLAKAFFTGDDETDENVFRLDQENIFTVRVERSDDSRAGFYLLGQYEVARMLRTLNSILST